MSNVKPPSFHEFVRDAGAPYIDYYRRLGVSANSEDVFGWYHDAANHREAPLFADVPAVLAHLLDRHEAVVGIITVQKSAIVREQCKQAGIDRHVHLIIGGVELKEDATRAFCARFRLAPARVSFFGDMRSDMRDARAAGVHAIGVTRGNPTADVLLEAGAERCIEHLAELPDGVCCGS